MFKDAIAPVMHPLSAGTIGACMLRAIYGISGDEALDRVQRSYDTRKDMYEDGTARLSPETEQQRHFVRSFEFSRVRS